VSKQLLKGIDAEVFEIPLIGKVLEYIALGFWLVTQAKAFKWMNAKAKLENITDISSFGNISSNFDQDPIYILCRHLIGSKHSGVVNWLWLFTLGLRSQGREVHVICESKTFKSEKLDIRGIQIHVVKPKLNFFQISELPLVKSWTLAAQEKVEELILTHGPGPIVGIQASLESDVRIPSDCKLILLLVTNHYLQAQSLGLDVSGRRSLKLLESERKLILQDQVSLFADSTLFRDLYFKMMNQVFGLQLENVGVVPVLTPDFKNTRRKKKVVTYIGRIDKRKNLSMLLEAWTLISYELDGWILEINGISGNDKKSLRKLRSGQVPLAIYNGGISDLEKQNVLSRTSVLVVPSSFESYGSVAVEGMKAGCIVLAAKVGGLKEIINEDFLLFSPNDPAELAEKLRIIALNPKVQTKYRNILHRNSVRHDLRSDFDLTCKAFGFK
jgi:glycosyltransferase involved in cell wall biosynthesis